MPENRNKKLWIGFDLGGTKMLASVFDSSFKQVGKARKKTLGRNGLKLGIGRIIETIQEAVKSAGAEAGKLGGIGLGIPGPLDPQSGIVLDTPNLGWRNFQLREPLQNEFGCPVCIINDVDAGVYGEYKFGAGRNARCVLGVFPGTGIGGGCVYEGRVFTGANRSCLEIGHLQMMPDGPVCGCGQRGCLEAFASRLAISAAAASAVFRGEAPYLQEAAGTDLSNIRSGALAAAIKAGDGAIELIVRSAAQWLGVGVANVVNLISPDVIVLGGGLVEAMPELYVDEVRQVLRKKVMPAFRDTYKVVVSELGDDAVAKGAAAWADAAAKG